MRFAESALVAGLFARRSTRRALLSLVEHPLAARLLVELTEPLHRVGLHGFPRRVASQLVCALPCRLALLSIALRVVGHRATLGEAFAFANTPHAGGPTPPGVDSNRAGTSTLSVNSSSQRSFVRRAAIAVGIVALVALFLVFAWTAFKILLLIFGAILFAVILDAGARLIRNHTAFPRWAALAIVCVVIVGSLTVLGVWLGPMISEQSAALREQLPAAADAARDWIAGLPWGNKLVARIPDVSALIPKDGGAVASALGTTFGVLGDIAFVLIAGFYLAATPDLYIRGVVKLVPPESRDRAREVLSELGHDLRRWLLGQVVAMLIIGVCFAIGLSIAGVPLSLVLGVIAGLLEFIPILGPAITTIPVALMAISVGPTTLLWAAVVFGVVQFIESWLVTPMVQKKAVEVPPVLLLSAQLMMAFAAGILGVILATPLLVAVMTLTRTLYIEDMLGDTAPSPA